MTVQRTNESGPVSIGLFTEANDYVEECHYTQSHNPRFMHIIVFGLWSFLSCYHLIHPFMF